MALKMKFVDGTEVGYLSATRDRKYALGESRPIITFDIEVGSVSLDTLDSLCTEENISTLLLTNDQVEVPYCDKEGNQLYNEEGLPLVTYTSVTNSYEGYALKVSLDVVSILVDEETNTYEERVQLVLGKRTYKEKQLHELGIY